MRMMCRAIPLAMLLLTLFSLNAEAWRRSPATTFATLPAGAAHPEGITVDAAGSSNLLLDLAFHPTTGALLVIDSGTSRY